MKEHYFYIKGDIDLSKYGFKFEHYRGAEEWVLWKQTRRLWVSNNDKLIHFNNVDKETLKVFYDMIKDDVVVHKHKEPRKRGTHYMTLNDEEFDLITKLRGEEEWKD